MPKKDATKNPFAGRWRIVSMSALGRRIGLYGEEIEEESLLKPAQ